ncbi:MAG: HIT domain-containing protein [Candidatus Pacebacteria bacterium]|nr:HIT domain-containing protein [Candidatus Paceibacterota bacterium]
MDDCLFCKIVAEEIPSHKIYEDEKFLAFLDINPINKGHILVIPKKHSRNILEMKDSLSGELMILVKKLATHIKNKLNADGINITINNEADAGQIIFHTHIHIIPRFKNDGFKHWNGIAYPKGEAEKIQSILKLN